MQPTPTDDEIRTSSAFPRVVRAYQLNNRIFWGGLPLFAATAIYATTAQQPWAFAAAGLLSVGSVCGQYYGFRRARQPLSEISGSPTVQDRARKLAHDAAKPRLVRWLPGV